MSETNPLDPVTGDPATAIGVTAVGGALAAVGGILLGQDDEPKHPKNEKDEG